MVTMRRLTEVLKTMKSSELSVSMCSANSQKGRTMSEEEPVTPARLKIPAPLAGISIVRPEEVMKQRFANDSLVGVNFDCRINTSNCHPRRQHYSNSGSESQILRY